jgi:hypothetical protein
MSTVSTLKVVHDKLCTYNVLRQMQSTHMREYTGTHANLQNTHIILHIAHANACIIYVFI